MPVLFGGHNLPPLVEIGLTDLLKSAGGGHGPRCNPPPSRPAPLDYVSGCEIRPRFAYFCTLGLFVHCNMSFIVPSQILSISLQSVFFLSPRICYIRVYFELGMQSF